MKTKEINDKILEELFEEIEGAAYINSFERKFKVFIIYPGVIFAFIAGLYYIAYLAPDTFSKVIIGSVLVFGAFLWINNKIICCYDRIC